MKPWHRGLLACFIGLAVGFGSGVLTEGDRSVPMLVIGVAVIATVYGAVEWLLLRHQRHGPRSGERAGEFGEDR